MIGRPRGAAVISAALAAIAGCGEDVARIELVVVPHPGGCGQVDGATTVTVTGLADSGAHVELLQVSQGPVSIESFPPDLRQITVEVRAAGTVLAHGKTAPFVVDTAAGVLPVSLAPPDGICPLGGLALPRRRPRVLAIDGGGALVFGGITGPILGPTDSVREVEYFDPATNAFRVIATPDTVAGFNAGAAATLTDGRIVLFGGAQSSYAFFDPVSLTLAPPLALVPRPYAAVIGLDDHRVLIAGGCTGIETDGVTCVAPLLSANILDVDQGSLEVLMNLQVPRADGIATLVPGPGGTTTVAFAGGFDPATGAAVTEVERISLDAGSLDRTPGAPGLAVALDTGAVLTTLAPPGAPGANTSAVYVPGYTPARATGFVAPRVRRDAALIGLEDGTVLAFGGVDEGSPDTAGAPLLYRPLDGWAVIGSAPPEAIVDHAAARLADGSVLVVGGRDATGAAVASARRFRPSLLGPFAAGSTVTPGGGTLNQLIALDPSLVDRSGGRFALVATGELDNRALIAGPRLAHGTMRATLELRDTGGFGLIARATGIGDRIEVVVEENQRVRVVRWTAGEPATVCEGIGVVPALADPTELVATLTIDGATLKLERDGAFDIDGCDLGDGDTPGLWGVSAIGGAAAGAHLDVRMIALLR